MKANALGTMLLASVLASPALAQDRPAPQPTSPQPTAPQPEHADRQEFPTDPALAKKFIERRLDETTKREEHLRALLARLEKGETPAEVGKDLEPGRQGLRELIRPREPDRADPHRAERGPDHGPDHQGSRGRISPEDRDYAMNFLRQNSPMLAARFEKIIKSEPETADRILSHMVSRMREADEAKQTNPGLFKLRIDEMEGGAALVDAMRAYREAKNATPPDQARMDQATEQLRAALARQLDNRLSLQRNEIESLSQRLTDLKADLEKKMASRDATIASMLARVKEGRDSHQDGRERAPHDQQPAPKP